MSQAAPAWRRVRSQGAFDARVQLSNGEQVLLTIVIPVLVLGVLAHTSSPSLGPGPRIDVLTPGVMALAVVSTSFTGQAIAAGFDRRYGVLRLFATTPLGRSGLLGGRVLAVLAIECVQVLVLGVEAFALGWRPQPAGVPIALVVGLVGTATFVSLGLLVGGTLRPEAVLAVANLVWLLLVAGGGIVVPASQLGPLGGLATWLPSGALGNALRAALVDGQVAWQAMAVLLAWTAVAAWAASRWFRWD